MDDSDKKRLRKNRCALVNNIEPTRIMDRLIELDVFTPDMGEEITSLATSRVSYMYKSLFPEMTV